MCIALENDKQDQCKQNTEKYIQTKLDSQVCLRLGTINNNKKHQFLYDMTCIYPVAWIEVADLK